MDKERTKSKTSCVLTRTFGLVNLFGRGETLHLAQIATKRSDFVTIGESPTSGTTLMDII